MCNPVSPAEWESTARELGLARLAVAPHHWPLFSEVGRTRAKWVWEEMQCGAGRAQTTAGGFILQRGGKWWVPDPLQEFP